MIPKGPASEGAPQSGRSSAPRTKSEIEVVRLRTRKVIFNHRSRRGDLEANASNVNSTTNALHWYHMTRLRGSTSRRDRSRVWTFGGPPGSNGSWTRTLTLSHGFLQRPADDTSNDGPHFSRGQVASVLHHVGVLLELQGANTFRIRSYLNGSRTIGSLQESLHDLVATGRLLEIKGIGKGLGGAISDAVMEGRWPDEWYDLERSVPSGLIDLLDVPNLGPKRIRILNQELGVTSVEELESACASGKVEGLKGFGAKSQQRYLDGIELLRRFRSRRRLDIGLRYGEALERRIRSMDGVLRATLAGSARRRKETIGDLDVVVAAHPEDHGPISEALQSIEGVVDVKGAGASKVSLILDASIFSEDGYALSHLDPKVLEAIGGTEYESMEASGTIDAQVRIVPPSMEAYTLAYFTGSKEHNIRMRQRAIERGLRLNEFGLAAEADLGELKGAATAEYSLPALEERDIYHHLDLEYVPPELREDLGEIEVAANGQVPMLLDGTSIRGALHNHTILSDGEASLEVMADKRKADGMVMDGHRRSFSDLDRGQRSIC